MASLPRIAGPASASTMTTTMARRLHQARRAAGSASSRTRRRRATMSNPVRAAATRRTRIHQVTGMNAKSPMIGTGFMLASR